MRLASWLVSCVLFTGSLSLHATTASEIVPSAAPRGARLIVVGTGLDATDLAVRFPVTGSSIAATVVAKTAALAEVIVPANAITGNLTVTAGGQISGTFAFTLQAAPAYTAVVTLAGGANVGASRDIPGSGTFAWPTGIAVQDNGAIFLADSMHNQIKVVTAAGVVTTFAGSGTAGTTDGASSSAKFNQPTGLAYDAARRLLYVCDSGNNRIRRIGADGSVSTFAGSVAGFLDASGTAARFRSPSGIAVDSTGALYVADSGNHRIRMISPAGVVSTFAGSAEGFQDGTAASARFDTPIGVALDADGSVYVADALNKAVRKIKGGTVSTVVRTTTQAPPRLLFPVAIAIDEQGRLLVSDSGTDTIDLVDLTASPATVSVVAGAGVEGYVNGAALSARFFDPTGLGASGSLLIADTRNSSVRRLQTAASIRDLYPRIGPAAGGNQIRIFGTGFVSGATQVRFGATAATAVSVVTATELFVTVPAGSTTVADVIVTTPSGSATLSGRYAYASAPTIAGVTPVKGPIGGGTTLTIGGANFVAGGTTVSIGGAPASLLAVTPASITAVAPPRPAGAADVTVQTSAGTATLSGAFRYLGVPTVGTFAPPSGGAGTVVTIQGLNFDTDAGATTVKFGTLDAAVSSVTATQIVATVPAAATTAPITVTTLGGTAESTTSFSTRTLTRIDLAPPTASLLVDETLAFVATAVYSDGTSQNITATAVWSSGSPTVASVNAAGVAKGVSAGIATVSAIFGGAAGTGTVRVSAIPTGPLPDPQTIASPIDPTVATSLFESTKFLYTGSPRMQTGLDATTIDPRRVAVIRGNVHDRTGGALQDVAISTLDGAEFGQTRTRADGNFDYVVNGGATVNLRFEKSGYLPVERRVDTKWNDYSLADPVVLVPQDTAVTAVDLSSATATTARATPATDGDGTRTATIVFKPGTAATLGMPDGTTRALSSLHVRATEYTVGAEGPNSMPASLPPTSGYTYCVELSADEVAAAGATGVTFTKPVVFYVENFLNFAVGGIVPTGFYDRSVSRWSSTGNGRVIRIHAIELGLAFVDTDGDGLPDDQARMNALGIDDAERAELARLYSPGQTLWRVPINHFSTYDCNWPYGPPPGAQAPQNGAPQGGSPLDHATCSIGSIIECENQTIGESVGITGTPFALNYRSDRVPGRRSNNALRIPITGDTPPTGTNGIRLQITVAGRQIDQTFPAAPNLSYTFNWDGRDAYGRQPEGMQPVTVRVGNVYTAQYQTAAQLEKSFGATTGVPVTTNRARQEIILWQEFRTAMGSWSASSAQFGGWSLSVHHAYDPARRTLYLGDGSRRNSVGNPEKILAQYAGGLLSPSSIASDAAGNLYIADPGNATGQGRIVRISPDKQLTVLMSSINPSRITATEDGILYIRDVDPVALQYRVARLEPKTGRLTNVLAGDGSPGVPVEGGQASQASINAGDIAAGPAGDLFFTWTLGGGSNTDIWHVDREGTLHKVAGCGPCSEELNNDDRPATDVALDPTLKIAPGREGELLILEQHYRLVRKISRDGRIYRLAGTAPGGRGGSAGDGGLARNADFSFNPTSLAVGPEGSVYVAESQRIRRIAPEGVISTEAGGESCAGNRAPAKLTCVQASDLTVDPQGVLYMLSSINVKDLEPAMPGISKAELEIASADGSELYVFDINGRHKRTIDAHTNAVLYQFGYDGAGLLARIQDGNGRVTTIERDGSGSAQAIVAPNGQRTALGAGRWLQSITNPAGEAFGFGYTADGLLTSFTNPRGKTSIVTYDGMGLLQRDADAAGGSTSIARGDTATGFVATKTTAMGRTTTFTVTNLPNGDRRRVVVDPAGLSESTVERDGSIITTTGPDGTTGVQSFAGDPRWGAEAPLLTRSELTLPSGRKRTLTIDRAVTLGDPNDPHTLQTETTKITLNGRVSTSVFDVASLTSTLTTAANRQYGSTFDGLGRLTAQTAPGLFPTRRTYDGLGRLASVSTGSRSVTFGYDSRDRLTSVTDPLARTVRFEYDESNRVIRQILPDLREIGFAYDANGNLTSTTPPARPPHLFTFTPLDLLEQYDPPPVAVAARTQYRYNLDRQLTRIDRPDGRSLILGYDAGGRGSSLTIGRGTFTYGFDPVSGNLATITDPSGGTIGYAYDGPVLTAASWQGPVSGSVAYAYDTDLRMTSEKVPCATSTAASCQPVSFGYDRDSLLAQEGALVLSRNPQNGLLSASTMGMVTDSWTYDGFGAPAVYEAKTNGTTVFHQDFVRDDGGRITRKTEIVTGKTVSFDYAYDVAGHLATVKQDGTLTATYQYDPNGNRLEKVSAGGTETGTFDSQDRCLTYAGTAYTYSANGELDTAVNSSGTSSFRYDELGNLLGATLANGTDVDYSIDGTNRRVGRTVNGQRLQRLLYSGMHPVAELDPDGNVTSRFVYGTRGNIPDLIIKGDTTYRVVADHLGSPRLIVNVADGTIAQRMDFDEFGNVLADSNPGFQPFGFAGGLGDPDTKLTRFGARDYDPRTGRWAVKDPIGFGGGSANVYGYAANDPINLIDPSGLKLCKTSLPGIGATFLDDQFAPTVDDFLTTANELGVHDLAVTQAFRTTAYQQKLRDDPSAYGATTPAQNSLHSAGWAIDINYRTRSESDRESIRDAADAVGLSWGGDFSKPDTVHFFVDPTGGNQKARKRLIKQAQKEYKRGGACGCD